MIIKQVKGLPALPPLWNETPKRLCLCHVSLPSCVILMTARPCGIYSAAGNQGPIPGLAAAHISKQVHLCWLALSPLSACVLFCMWVHCLPIWNSNSVGNNAPTSSRITMSLWNPLQNPNKQQQAGLSSFMDTSWGVQMPLSPHLYFPGRHGSLGGWRSCICSSSPLCKSNRRGLRAPDRAGTGAGSACC